MKQVYDCEQFIALGTKAEFKHTSIWDNLHLLDAEEALSRTNRTYYKTFAEFFEACQKGLVRNADAHFGLVRNADAYLGLFKVRKVKVRCGIDWFTITARNFPGEICVWNNAKNVSHYSMKKLMENLPADEFAEYLRERNIALHTN